ncbi:MAG: hypothetical protein ACUVRM_03725 [Bacillota bacterium]
MGGEELGGLKEHGFEVFGARVVQGLPDQTDGRQGVEVFLLGVARGALGFLGRRVFEDGNGVLAVVAQGGHHLLHES